MATRREREIIREWRDFTGFSFMPPNDGETFYDALQKNRQWLHNFAGEAETIGNDIENPHLWLEKQLDSCKAETEEWPDKKKQPFGNPEQFSP